MGTIIKEATIRGKTLQEAFKTLQEEDRDEHGNDIYNGGWNNCQGIKEVTASEFDRKLSAGDMSKHEPAVAKCTRKPVLNTNTIKTQVERFPNKGARKWVTKYVAYETQWGTQIVNEESQAEAIRKVREHVAKNPNQRISVDIIKELQGDTKVATITYKPAKNEADGEWEIYGGMPY
jgi:hypothetical protein